MFLAVFLVVFLVALLSAPVLAWEEFLEPRLRLNQLPKRLPRLSTGLLPGWVQAFPDLVLVLAFLDSGQVLAFLDSGQGQVQYLDLWPQLRQRNTVVFLVAFLAVSLAAFLAVSLAVSLAFLAYLVALVERVSQAV